MEVDGETHEVEAAVSETLPVSMLMGTDVPVSKSLVKNNLRDGEGTECALAVRTSAQKKELEDEEQSTQLREEESGVCPRQLHTEPQERMSVLPDFDDELFVGGRMKVKISRSEKRARRQEYQKKDGTS